MDSLLNWTQLRKEAVSLQIHGQKLFKLKKKKKKKTRKERNERKKKT